ncbi:MAG TPA: hypothetical protein VM866_11425 [Pyrinomonadaceae bacterium]|jgi:hypothetical protein|nr:hypothetical protein [Pyrinomonadaceae bacterium]
MKKTFAQSLCEAEARGAETARRAVARFETDEVFTLARRAGVKITYGRWPLVTIGECEKRSRTIRINLNAIERANSIKYLGKELLERAIIAHELAHLFDTRTEKLSADKSTERLIDEHTAHGFAAQLLQVSCAELRNFESHFKNADR